MARDYRRALWILAPAVCAAMDAEYVRLGQGWVCPRPAPFEPHDLLTLALVVDHFCVSPSTVDRWRSQGLRVVRTPDGPRYVFADVEAFLARRREARDQRGK